EIIVVDSGSSDRTLEIAKQLGAKVFTQPWSGYGQQKNFAQSKASNPWILNLDADEEVTPGLKAEIQSQLLEVSEGRSEAKGFYFPRKTFYLGRWIKHGGWYPNHLIRLAEGAVSKWTEPHVHEELLVTGKVLGLKEPLHHHSFPGIIDQVSTNLRFSRLGSEDLMIKGHRPKLSKLILKPLGKFIETYFIKKGFLDGLPGFIISVNAAYSIFLKYAYLFEPEIKVESSHR
ncbi:MAG: glycosyltransferase family 2 protein, partial [Bdellovibrionota bacterium]